MKNFYIDHNLGTWTNAELARVTEVPGLILGSAPTWQLNIVQSDGNGGNTGIDLSDAASFRAAVDNDFDHSSAPMLRTPSGDIDMTGAVSGILKVPLDASGTEFAAKLGTRQSIPAWLEVAGLDSQGKTIYCWQLRVNCLNSIDPTGE